MDPASFGRQFYRVGSTDDPSIREVGAPSRVSRSRSSAAGLDSFPERNYHSHAVSRNYVGRPFRPPGGNPSAGRRSGSNGSDGSGALAARNHHYPSPLTPPAAAADMQGARGRFRPGPVTREAASSRHLNNLPHLRMLPEDGVAILDISIYQVGDLSELGSRGDDQNINGNQSSGLSQESITNGLKTRICHKLEEGAIIDKEDDSCIICQEDYQNQEKIGFLDCGHEYHADCLNKWLLLKNVCPICKAPAMTSL